MTTEDISACRPCLPGYHVAKNELFLHLFVFNQLSLRLTLSLYKCQKYKPKWQGFNLVIQID